MRKIILLIAAVAAFVLIGITIWIRVGTPTTTSALAGSTVDPSAMVTDAKYLPTYAL